MNEEIYQFGHYPFSPPPPSEVVRQSLGYYVGRVRAEEQAPGRTGQTWQDIAWEASGGDQEVIKMIRRSMEQNRYGGGPW